MILDKSLLEQHNSLQQRRHQQKFQALKSVLTEEGHAVDAIVDQVAAFQIAIPSWALGTGGTFFWWIALYPGLAIFLTVFAYNLIGEALRDAIDPKLKVEP